MAECILLKSGGGVSSDELTATSANVLADTKYVGADTNDEIGVGTMPNNGEFNWNPTEATTEILQEGYYSGGTLDSSGAYGAGANATKVPIIEALNSKMSNQLGVDSSIDEIVSQIGSFAIFNSGVVVQVYGTGYDPTLIPEWTGTASASVDNGSHASWANNASCTIKAGNSIDLTSVKSIVAYISKTNSGGCGDYNDYEDCGWNNCTVTIYVYDSTNTNLVLSSAAADNSTVLDVSNLSGFYYIWIYAYIQHVKRGNGSVTISKVNLNV